MLFISVITSLLALASAAPTLDHNRVVVRDGNGTLFENAKAIIPLEDVGCWDERLETEDADGAKEKIIQWGHRHHVTAGGWHGEEHGDGAVWICNCKHFASDHAVPAELDEAQQIIKDICGDNSSGWVWSKKWQKSINYGTAKRLNIGGWSTKRCPGDCLWNNDSKEGHRAKARKSAVWF